MTQQQAETEVASADGQKNLQDVFRGIWDKAKAASDLITRLVDERRELLKRTGELEESVRSLRNDLAAREQELKRVKGDYSSLLSANGTQSFSVEEKEIIKGRVRDLIAKINSYL